MCVCLGSVCYKIFHDSITISNAKIFYTSETVYVHKGGMCQSCPLEGARFSFNANVTRPKWMNWSNRILVIDVVHIRAELRLMHAVVLSCWTLQALGIKKPCRGCNVCKDRVIFWRIFST